MSFAHIDPQSLLSVQPRLIGLPRLHISSLPPKYGAWRVESVTSVAFFLSPLVRSRRTSSFARKERIINRNKPPKPATRELTHCFSRLLSCLIAFVLFLFDIHVFLCLYVSASAIRTIKAHLFVVFTHRTYHTDQGGGWLMVYGKHSTQPISQVPYLGTYVHVFIHVRAIWDVVVYKLLLRTRCSQRTIFEIPDLVASAYLRPNSVNHLDHGGGVSEGLGV